MLLGPPSLLWCSLCIEQALWRLVKGLVDIYRMCNLVLLIIESLHSSAYTLVSINLRSKFPFTLAHSEP